uniref:Transmembrane protein n=1 Tax=Toxoplasma gondii (strain ATCC 50861 / VEG) TaxID=432359 RepID=A0A0F7UUZ2_TOXGV|nr:TPA: hypothetical protein BN1205_034300 [Toxoplasma gondii VEG]
MEKYRVFGDESTGVHPFVPVAYMKAQLSPPPASVVSRLLSAGASVCSLAFSSLLVTLRLLLLLVAALWAILLQQLLLVFSLFPSLHWRLSLSLLAPPARLALFALGVWWLDEQPAAARTSSCRVCLSSFASLVEPLYLSYRLSPQFVLLHEEGGFSFCSLWAVLKFSMQFRLAPGKGAFRSLSALMLAHEKNSSPRIPLVIFPEGQKSNGTCILQWTAAEGGAGREDREKVDAGFDAAALHALDGRIAEVGCLYTSLLASGKAGSPSRAVPYGLPHTVNAPLEHLRRVLAEKAHGVSAVWAAPAAVQASVQQQLQSRGVSTPASVLDCLREVMIRMLPGVTGVQSKGGADLRAFNAYWERTQKEQYLKNR